MTRVVQVGLGPIGLAVTRELVKSKKLQIVGAVDLNETMLGQDLGRLAGIESLGVPVSDSLVDLRADVAVITTTSSLEAANETILQAVRAGMNVVSTCEELAYPWKTNPALSKELDDTAREHQVTILGTGINPGFLMDYLPVALSGICHSVNRVRIERIQNAALRRLPFQRKIGAGLELEEFRTRVQAGTLRHVGLTESMHMIASRLGWKLDKTEDIVEPVVAAEHFSTKELRVRPGHALGVSQTGKALVEGREVITLVFRATVGEPTSYDRIQLDGTPPIDMRIDGGVNGDIGTVAVTINAAEAVVDAPSGLKTMIDIPTVACSNSRSQCL